MTPIVHVWECQIRPGREAEFESNYGHGGTWARLFRSAEGYGGTVLRRDPAHHGRYVTIDHWASERAYEQFRSARAADYAELDAACEALTVSERSLGRFDVAAPELA